MSTITPFGPLPTNALNISPVPNGGSGNMSASLQQWINSLANGEIGIMQPGSYGISSSLTIPSNTTIFAYNAKIVWNGAASAQIVNYGAANGNCCVLTNVFGLTVDAQNVSGTICHAFHSAQHCHFDNLYARNAGNIGFYAPSDATSGYDGDQQVFDGFGNHFGHLYAYNCLIGFYAAGLGALTPFTDNSLDFLFLYNVTDGIVFGQYTDSNRIGYVHNTLFNGGVGITLNSNGAALSGVYNNQIGYIGVDVVSGTVTIISTGANERPNVIHQVFTSPNPLGASGTLLTSVAGSQWDIGFVGETPPYRSVSGYHAEKFAGTAPTAIAGTNAGTGPPAPVVATSASDVAGTLTFGTGTTPAAGDMVDVTFAAAYQTAPRLVLLTTLTAQAASLALYVQTADITTTGFKIRAQTAPSASQANTVYGVAYQVIA